MTEAINIFGGVGCRLLDGRLCTACCYPLKIPGLKEAGEICRHIGPNGCRIHTASNRSDRCKKFHCSIYSKPEYQGQISKQQALLILASALLFQLITQEQYKNLISQL